MDSVTNPGGEAVQQFAGAPLTVRRRMMLADFVEAFLPLDEDQKRELEERLNTEKYAGVKAMNKTHYEMGEEIGEEIGRRSMLHIVLEARFGTLSAAVEERLKQMPSQELIGFAKAVMHAESLAELGLEK